jgi:hypothetical protein
MNHKDEKFDKLKRWVIGISGVGMAIASIILSKQGVGITGDLAWIGTVVALSLFCAELMFNSNFDELNWTILFLGLGAYIYSIWTNIQGFYFYRGIEGTLFTNFDTTSFFGGVFMDVYPELAIAWAMGASKIGDLIGNVVKTSKDPDKLTQAKSSTNNNSGQSKPVQYRNNAPMRPVPPPPHSPGFQPSPKPYPTQHKVTKPRGEDDDEMMSRAA